ncbi:hypothetical protein [Agromyces badenianii]|uniref:hypothetical protein n=1 Tax=Agromyces badenianii TaxID=2080742 RepID=UPI000D58E01B|nr:hypothetical protein [Agromyces badenianii]PWC05422.1 hypothetical protein DCE94_03885 [Agromyces badenianii]
MLRTHSSTEKVDLFPLGETMWRVCDVRNAGESKIVGYLKLVDGGYEMLWMRPLLGITRTYPTLDAALEAIYVSVD